MKNICYDFDAPSDFKDYIFGKLPIDTICSLDELQSIVESVTSLIPTNILNRMEDEGWKITITNKRNLEQEYNFDIKVYRLTDFSKKEILTYATPTAIRYSIPHEIGHFVDSLFDFVSQSKEWDAIFRIEQSNVKQIRGNYFILYDTPEEFFAECFGAYILMSQSEKDDLKKKHLLSNSMDCIARMIKVLPYVKKKNKTTLEQYMDGTIACETKFW